tara:strand:- start:2630 stop:3721 length:1092 start_codon:yes stop_codon:yes gene_type:complete
MPIEEFNKVDVETTSSSLSFVENEDFNGQTNVTSGGSAWTPSGSASGWAVGEDCIDTQGNPNKYWLTSGSTLTPEFPVNRVVGDWQCDTGQTQSQHTGPFGGHDEEGDYTTAAANDYIYTEMTNSAQRASPLVVRTAGYSLGDSSGTGLDMEFYVWAAGAAIGTLAVYESTSSTAYGSQSDINLLAKFKAYSFNNSGSNSYTSGTGGRTRLKGVLNLGGGVGLQSFANAFFDGVWPRTVSGNSGNDLSTWKKVTIPLDGFYNDAQTAYPNYLNDTTETRYFYIVHHTHLNGSEMQAVGADTDINSEGDNVTTSGFGNYMGDLAIDDFQIRKTTSTSTVLLDSINKVDADGTPAVSWNGVTLLS